MVDDGSTDGSGAICDSYGKNDKRIRVVHEQNHGNGYARNVGLTQSKGQWIIFVDSDDVIHKRLVEILLDIAKTKDADIVVGGYKSFINGEDVDDEIIDDNYIAVAELLTINHLYNDDFIKRHSMILTVPWCKIIKKAIHDGIMYPNKRRNLDTWTTWKIYENADRVIYLEQPLYYWRESPFSLTRQAFSTNYYSAIEAYMEQLEYYYKAGKQRYVEIVFAEYTQEMFWLYNRMKENKINTAPLRKYLVYMRKHLNYVKLTKSLGLYSWLRYRYLAYYKIPKLLDANNRIDIE
jgi:glycosyltransferase involved in cell wall biosynthesis